MSFDKKYDNLVKNAIIPGVEDVFGPNSCIRADYQNHLGVVTDKIADGIINCDYIIAILTDNNVNMMYELGFAHAFNKPTIIFAPDQDLNTIPFDIRSQEIKSYYYCIDDQSVSLEDQCKKIKEDIKVYLNTIDNHITRYGNPISNYFLDKYVFISDLKEWLLSLSDIIKILTNSSEVWDMPHDIFWYAYDEYFSKLLIESIINKERKFYIMLPDTDHIKSEVRLFMKSLEKMQISKDYLNFVHAVFIDPYLYNISPFPITIYDPLTPKAIGILQEPMINVGDNNLIFPINQDNNMEVSKTEQMKENTFDIKISKSKMSAFKIFFQDKWNEAINKELNFEGIDNENRLNLQNWII